MGGMTCLLLLLWAGVTVSTAVDLHKRIAVIRCDNNQRHHHVKLIVNDGRDELCGGTLISDRWILTALHCKARTMTAHLGLHPPTGKNIAPMKITDPPVIFNKDHDIMLLKLPKPVKPEDIKPVDLPPTTNCVHPPIGAAVQIAGYGPTVEGGPWSQNLLCANTAVVAYQDIGIHTHKNLFCGDSQTVTPLPGDSGGGVVFNNKIYGVISEGVGHPYPTYFMDVCRYLGWIQSTIGP